MTQRDFTNAKPNTNDGSKALQYISRRQEIVREPGGQGSPSGDREQWRELEPVSGSDREIKEGIEWRGKKEREVSYMSLVVSPERTDVGLRDKDYERIAKVWSRSATGKDERHVAYVHRDTDHEHMHVMVSRGMYSKAELERNHEQTREIIRERERERDQERSIEKVYERENERQRELEHRQERERDRAAGRVLERGEEIERER